MNKGQEINSVEFKSRDDSPVIIQPRKEAFDFPATDISAQRAAILGRGLDPVALMRSNQSDFISAQLLIQGITIIGLVPNQYLGSIFDKSLSNGFCNQFRFMRRGAFDMYGERKTSAVCNCHDLGPLPSFSFPHGKTPFFAPAKEPSIKHSRRSRPPRSLRSWASNRNIFSNTPFLAKSWNRRWQVWYGGYRSGRSFQGAPVRNIHNIPFMTARESCHGRPRLSGLVGNSGKLDSINFHCSSFKSIHVTPCLKQHAVYYHVMSIYFF
jgi:hypothetical protein